MSKKALVVIDIQNDITKHCKDIIENINSAIVGNVPIAYRMWEEKYFRGLQDIR